MRFFLLLLFIQKLHHHLESKVARIEMPQVNITYNFGIECGNAALVEKHICSVCGGLGG